MNKLVSFYQRWIPFLARYIFAAAFAISAFGKFPGTHQFFAEVSMTGAAGIPFPMVAVILAFILEVCSIIALVTGYYIRLAAFLLAGFVFILAFTFFRDLSSQTNFGYFVSCFELIAGLLYVSAYGTQKVTS